MCLKKVFFMSAAVDMGSIVHENYDAKKQIVESIAGNGIAPASGTCPKRTFPPFTGPSHEEPIFGTGSSCAKSARDVHEASRFGGEELNGGSG